MCVGTEVTRLGQFAEVVPYCVDTGVSHVPHDLTMRRGSAGSLYYFEYVFEYFGSVLTHGRGSVVRGTQVSPCMDYPCDLGCELPFLAVPGPQSYFFLWESVRLYRRINLLIVGVDTPSAFAICACVL